MFPRPTVLINGNLPSNSREKIKNQPVITSYFSIVDRVIGTIVDYLEYEKPLVMLNLPEYTIFEEEKLQNKGLLLNKLKKMLLDLARHSLDILQPEISVVTQ